MRNIMVKKYMGHKKIAFLPFAILSFFASCDLSKYPIDDQAMIKIDGRLLGRWIEDKNVKYPMEYALVRKDDFKYTVIFQENKNEPAKYLSAWFSEIGTARFLNVHYNSDTVEGRPVPGGYLFIRILDINAAANRVRATGIADTNLKYLNSSQEVRAKISQHLNDAKYYSDTIKFRRVK